MPKLRDGSFNAVLSSGDGGAGRKLWDFLPHFTEIDYALPLSIASLNSASYEALNEDLKRQSIRLQPRRKLISGVPLNRGFRRITTACALTA